MHQMRWTIEKLLARLHFIEHDAVYRQKEPIAPFKFHAGSEPLVDGDVDDVNWPIIRPGEYWGALRQEFTLRTLFVVPNEMGSPIALYLPLGNSKSLEALAFLYGPEALAYVDGQPLQGIDPNHCELLLPDTFRDGKTHVLALHGWTGIKDERYEMGQSALVHIDQTVRAFVASARAAIDVVRQLSDSDPIRARLLNALDHAFLLLDLREPLDVAFYQSVLVAHQTLRAGVAAAGSPMQVTVSGVGHAHIDVAWLWPLSQTRKKVARTFSTVLRLMEQYPDFRFAQSQPQLYKYLSEDHPDIMEQVKARVAEDRWEIIGGMWIEADCNITGAESLVRQFVLGRRYFAEQFGQRESPILWLPDVFGYSWQLPQLIVQAGLSYFVTAKLSWNQYNRIPYDRFWWQGLDGTRILTNFITTAKPGWWGATYSAELTPEEVMTTWKELQQRELHPAFMIAFGHGDGGGGPTRHMIENSHELAEFPGFPQLRLEQAHVFMERLEREAGPYLPTWDGELYLELHRGTYTSQAQNKRANRKSEFLLHDAEFLAAWATLDGNYDYPHAELNRAWELVCLNQFHDIIPGSSIHQVYVDSSQDYAEIRHIGEQVRDEALSALDRHLPVGTDLAIYNPTSFFRSEIVEIQGDRLGDNLVITTLEGRALPMQPAERNWLIEIPTVPPYGYLALKMESGNKPDIQTSMYAGSVSNAPSSAGTHLTATNILENTALRVEFDDAGDIVRLYDKRADREILPLGSSANQWQAFEDRPLDWEAWDIEIYFDEKRWLADPADSIQVIESGPLRSGLEIRRRILNSKIVQRIYLHRESTRLDFDTWIDWQERHVLLKTAFPVSVLGPHATYEIQWGNVERPTHRNTSWDWARFESCAHKWVDLSEGDYGVSLLNDCKYGHDILGNTIRLTLLKGATFPDPMADLGEHRFTYSLYPHLGNWREGTVPAAYALNDPLIVHRVQADEPQGLSGVSTVSLLQTDREAVVVETIKQAEDGDGLVVRLYEHHRTRGNVTLTTSFPMSSAAQCNLLEEEMLVLKTAGNRITLPYCPYQIITLRLHPIQ